MKLVKIILCSISLAIVMTVSNLHAAVSSDSDYIWTGVSGGAFSVTTESPGGTTFNISDLSNNNVAVLSAPSSATILFSLTSQNESGLTYYKLSWMFGNIPSIESGSLKLYGSSQFGFSFTEGNTIYSSYSLNTTTDGQLWNIAYTGSDPNANMSVTIQNFGGIAGNPTAVPIPGSALLLGSSLLGLVGIGARRKLA